MADLPLKRNRYRDASDSTFECSFIPRNLSEDFENFHLRAARTLRRGLYEPGIVTGLEVHGAPGSSEVTVESGVAIDALGRLIVLARGGGADVGTNPLQGEHQETAVPASLSLAGLSAASFYYLTIEFSEINRFNEGTDCGRLEQVPWLRFQPEGTILDETAVVLAVASVGSGGQLLSLESHQDRLPGRRRRLGSTLGQLTIAATGSGDGPPSGTASAGHIAASGDGGLHLEPQGGPLTVAGALRVGDGATIGTFSEDPHLRGGREAVPTAAAVKTYVDELARLIRTALENCATKSEVDNHRGWLETVLSNRAKLEGDGGQDFLTRDLQVRGLLTTLGNLEVGGDLRLQGSHIRDAGNRARITMADSGVLELREDNGGVALSVSNAGGVTIGYSNSSQNIVKGQLTVTGDLHLDGRDIRDNSNTRRITIHGGGTLSLKRSNGSAALTVHSRNYTEIAGDLKISGNLRTLDVSEESGHAYIHTHDLWLGHSARGTAKGPRHRNAYGRAMVDSGTHLSLNWEHDWIHGIQYWGSLRHVSSRETKEDITSLSAQEAFDVLTGLVPTSFSYRANPEKSRCLGFIAEEVPDIVAASDHKSIIESHILAVLTRVVKEQQRVIDELSQRVEAL